MAQIDILIPFLLYHETRLKKSELLLPLPQMFERAKLSGYADDPDDAGGATMCGVTLETYKSYCRKRGYPVPTALRLRNITFDQWVDILRTMYWDRWKADQINVQPIANILVDWVWASGSYGITIPQKILGVEQDGIVGKITIGAVNSAPAEKLFNEIHGARIAFVDGIVWRNPSQKKFIRGWKRRINSITFNGLSYE